MLAILAKIRQGCNADNFVVVVVVFFIIIIIIIIIQSQTHIITYNALNLLTTRYDTYCTYK